MKVFVFCFGMISFYKHSRFVIVINIFFSFLISIYLFQYISSQRPSDKLNGIILNVVQGVFPNDQLRGVVFLKGRTGKPGTRQTHTTQTLKPLSRLVRTDDVDGDRHESSFVGLKGSRNRLTDRQVRTQEEEKVFSFKQ